MANVVFNSFAEYLGDGTMDMNSDTFKVALVADTYTPDATDTVWADISANEISGTGYTTGGATLGSVTWIRSGATTTFDCANPTWTTATFTARYGVIYDTTPVSPTNPVVMLLDFGSNQSPSGVDFIINVNASGLFSIASA